jgi:hypothetical protein
VVRIAAYAADKLPRSQLARPFTARWGNVDHIGYLQRKRTYTGRWTHELYVLVCSRERAPPQTWLTEGAQVGIEILSFQGPFVRSRLRAALVWALASCSWVECAALPRATPPSRWV